MQPLWHLLAYLTAILPLASCQYSVDQTILIFARSTSEAYSAYSGLAGYGIPYQVVIVPQSGVTLPTLASSASHGSYGGFIILSEVGYDYGNGNWSSALSPSQFTQLYSYQTTFNVRMVRLDCYPQPMYGTATAISGAGCCGTGVEQLISLTNSSGFPTANINTGATMSTMSMWHYPAVITDTTGSTWPVAQFAPDSAGTFTGTTVAAVINNFSGCEQMVFFASWATSWSPTSNFLQHAYIHWMTRGFFLGQRKIYFNTQIDDVHLSTQTYNPGNYTFRTSPSDFANHATWMKSINSRLPSGSNYRVELGHNGNGDIGNATVTEYSASVDVCNPVDAVWPNDPGLTSLEFQKPLGTGTDQWPTTPTNYTWNTQCAYIDPLAKWFSSSTNRDAYSHISHTFTHLDLDNATWSDTYKEIQFNQAWLKQIGIAAGAFSPHGLIPPAITGLHNGDAIQAWMQLGITSAVGDNSRPVLTNQQNPWWPLTSTVSANGYAGLNIIPRKATTIYYNCDVPACTTQEWIDTSAGSGDFSSLLAFEKSQTLGYLLALRQDPYMFHQANLRTDVPAQTVGSVTVNSLLQIWVETITQELMRLTKWPLVTKKHDDIAQIFLQRVARDNCNPMLTYQYGSNGTKITGATVTVPSGNSCSAPIGITVPGAVTASGGSTSKDQLGSEPAIIWATLAGTAVSLSLATPISAL